MAQRFNKPFNTALNIDGTAYGPRLGGRGDELGCVKPIFLNRFNKSTRHANHFCLSEVMSSSPTKKYFCFSEMKSGLYE